MNILYINHYAGNPEMGMEFRPYYLSREWIKQGHNVTIIAANYSHLRRINPQVDYDFQEEYIDGIKYVWIKTNTYQGNGLSRAKTMFSFVRKLRKNAKKIIEMENPDVVITSSTYPLDTYVGQKIRKISSKNVKLIHEVHDMWPLTLIEIGGISKFNPFIVMLQIAENSAYKHSDRVVSLLPYSKEYMIKHGLKGEKFKYIPNGIFLNDSDEAKTNNSLIKIKNYVKEKKRENKFIVGYIGGHALSNALYDLISVCEKMRDTDVHFILVGDGNEKDNIISLVNEKKLENVCFHDPVPKYNVHELLSFFDCAYIGALDSPLYRFGVCMNKIFDYMYAGLPIVAAITTPSLQVSDQKCGITVNSGDIDGIVDGIIKIKNMTIDERITMGKRGQASINEKYRYDKLAKEFEEIFV